MSFNFFSASNTNGIVHLSNNYFNSVFTNRDFVLASLDKLPNPSTQLNHTDIGSNNIFQDLMPLNISKAGGCDDISPHFLKLSATALLTTRTLLREWNVHKISPITKGRNILCSNNDRPISLLRILCTVLESTVFHKVVDLFRLLISSSQHCFVQG